MINNRVAIVTAYIPDPLNENGGPSGLLWEIINYLNNELNIETDVIYKPISKNTLIRVLQRNGLYISKCENKFDSYKYIIVYPDDVLFFADLKSTTFSPSLPLPSADLLELSPGSCYGL